MSAYLCEYNPQAYTRYLFTADKKNRIPVFVVFTPHELFNAVCTNANRVQFNSVIQSEIC